MMNTQSNDQSNSQGNSKSDSKNNARTSNPKDRTWGIGIALFYSAFVLVTLGLVFYATLQQFDLVAENYYEDGVNYQDRIDQKNLAARADHKLAISYQSSSQELEITFPNFVASDSIDGHVVLFRPSNASLDRRWEIDLDANGILQLDLRGVARGSWKVMVYWRSGADDLFTEESIFIE